jgi:hypothetical protein
MSRFSLILAALAVALAGGLAVVCVPALAQDDAARVYGVTPTTNIWAGIYTREQAVQGAAIYVAACSGCHGEELEGNPGDGFPPLASSYFKFEWDGQTMADLVNHIHTGPRENDMDPVTAVALAAFILNQNGVPFGNTPLSTDAREEAKILFTQYKPK